VSNITTLVIALMLFKFISDDIWQFRILAGLVTVFGLMCSTSYLFGVKENYLRKVAIEQAGFDFDSGSSDSDEDVDSWRDWLKKN